MIDTGIITHFNVMIQLQINLSDLEASEYVGIGCCKGSPVRPPIANYDRGQCESLCQSDTSCNGFSYGNLKRPLNSKTTPYCLLYRVCDTSRGGDGTCYTSGLLDQEWSSFESWAMKKGIRYLYWVVSGFGF